jgi:aquaporin Z
VLPWQRHRSINEPATANCEEATMPLSRKVTAEFIGTFWLVFGGCGSAVLAAGVPDVGIGWLGVALAFGLTLLTMAFALGHISGCHLNPAVSVGLIAGGRFPVSELGPYVLAQLWLFWVAPIAGAVAGGSFYRWMSER